MILFGDLYPQVINLFAERMRFFTLPLGGVVVDRGLIVFGVNIIHRVAIGFEVLQRSGHGDLLLVRKRSCCFFDDGMFAKRGGGAKIIDLLLQ